ncbi:MAG: addiction module protein [Planctomycetota bacterium]
MHYEELVIEVLSLPEAQQEELFLTLRERLRLARVQHAHETGEPAKAEPSNEEWQKAWTAEINRRIAEMDSGQVQGIPADDVFAEMRARIRSRAAERNVTR